MHTGSREPGRPHACPTLLSSIGNNGWAVDQPMGDMPTASSSGSDGWSPKASGLQVEKPCAGTHPAGMDMSSSRSRKSRFAWVRKLVRGYQSRTRRMLVQNGNKNQIK